MSEENKRNEGLKNSTKSVDKSRRAFAKAGIATPVIMTLSSKPVFGAQCLSEMLSTTMSGPGNSCAGGQSPGFWKLLTGKTDPWQMMEGVEAAVAWARTGLDYGTLRTSCVKNNGKPRKCKMNSWQDYEGGTPLNSLPFGIIDGRSLREILNTEGGTDIFHLLAGLLNARFYDYASTEGYYIFSEPEFWQMYNDSTLVPAPYTDLRDLIESNYHNNP